MLGDFPGTLPHTMRFRLAACLLALFVASGCASREGTSVGGPAATETAAREPGEKKAEGGLARLAAPPHDVYPGVTSWPPKGVEIKPYPFDRCAVINKKLSSRYYTRYYQGYEVKFCCTPCRNAFEVNPEPWMPRIRAAHAAPPAGDQQGVSTESVTAEHAEALDSTGQVASFDSEPYPGG